MGWQDFFHVDKLPELGGAAAPPAPPVPYAYDHGNLGVSDRALLYKSVVPRLPECLLIIKSVECCVLLSIV